MLTADEHELSFVNGKDIRYFFFDAFLFGPDRIYFKEQFFKLKKDHERFVPAESIPTLLTILTSKIQNSVVLLLFSINY